MLKSQIIKLTRNKAENDMISEKNFDKNVIIIILIILLQLTSKYQTLNSVTEISNDENSSLLMNSANNVFNKSHRNIFSGKTENKIQKLISPTKNNSTIKNDSSFQKFNKSNNKSEMKSNINKQKGNKSFLERWYTRKDIYEKIVYIQNWWKFMKKIILIQKHVKCFLRRKKYISVKYMIKIIYRLYFKKLIDNLRAKEKANENNQDYLNEVNKNLKNNFIKKIKKYETSTKFNKRKKVKNNSLFYNSKGNKYLLMKKLEESKRTRNENLKSFNTSNGSNFLNTLNINKENTKYILLNDSNSNIYKNKVNKEKEVNKIKSNIFSQEKINAFNNIFNIYNNVKKIYKNNNTNNICETVYSTTNNFYSKNNSFKLKANKENKKLRNKKGINKNIIINKNNNINVNININDIQKEENSHLNKIIKLRKFFKFWKEIVVKKNIIKNIKNIEVKKTFENELNIFKNRLKDKKIKNKTDSLLITKNKLNFSNSIINQRISHIIPKKLNQTKKDNNINNKQCIYNYGKKKNKTNNLKKTNEKKSYNKNNQNKVNKFLPLSSRNKEEKEKYYFYKLIKLIEKLNNFTKVKKYFEMWKLIIKLKQNNSKGIEEKIINFKTKKSPFKVMNNSVFNIFNKAEDFKNQNNNTSRNYFCQTESNMNLSHSHLRANSIGFQKDIILSPLNFSKDKFNKNINKSIMKSPKIIYKKKLLIDGMKVKKVEHMDKAANLTLNGSSFDFDILNRTEGNFFKYKDKNSIYGGKFYKGNNIIEEREICFTPNKNSTFKNNFGININVVENYLNRGIERNETENNNIKNIGIKTKQIIFSEKNKIL